jgi:hypothetical protein
MKRLLTDQKLREELRTKGLERAAQFRWSVTAEQVLNCFQELAGMGLRRLLCYCSALPVLLFV